MQRESGSDVRVPVIFVLAGVNGAGKSSVAGASIQKRGGPFFNPDEVARRLRAEEGLTLLESNERAWKEGKERLEAAISERKDFTFESTLGGNTIPRLLGKAAAAGLDVVVWFVGLSSPEQHLARVRARVAAGGHDIPEEKIRERWDGSRRNIIDLLPSLAELMVYDNSAEADPVTNEIPAPILRLHWRRGRVLGPDIEQLRQTPEWAEPIVANALRLQRLGR